MQSPPPAQDGGPPRRGPPDTTAAILAGGKGTRLREAVPDRPKALAEVAGRPLLAYLLAQLERHGFARVVLCTGHMGERVREAVGPKFGRLAIAYSQEPAPLGTGGALRLALAMLDSPDVLVMNGDSYCGADLGALLAFHTAGSSTRPRAGSLTVVRAADARRYGCVRFGPDGRVTAFEEKDRAAGAGWINAGVYALARDAIAEVPAGRAISLEKELFPQWAGRGLYAWPAAGAPFIDIGCPESYKDAQAFFAPGGPGGQAGPAARRALDRRGRRERRGK